MSANDRLRKFRALARIERDDKILALYYDGASVPEIVAKMGISRQTVYAAIHAAADDGLDDTSGERCQCGLRLPCQDCLPSAEFFTRGDGPIFP